MRSRSTQLKERMKSYSLYLKNKKKEVEEEKTLEEEMDEIRSHIKLCEYDLEHNFRGNLAIIKKIKFLKERLEKLKNE